MNTFRNYCGAQTTDDLISFFDFSVTCHDVTHGKNLVVGWRHHPSKQDHFVVEQSWRLY